MKRKTEKEKQISSERKIRKKIKSQQESGAKN